MSGKTQSKRSRTDQNPISTLPVSYTAKRTAEPEWPTLIGQRVAQRYEVGKYAGSGAFAVVFRGHDCSTRPRTKVSIKVLKTKHTRNHAVRSRFLLEARTLKSIQHPLILAISDVGIDYHVSNPIPVYFLVESHLSGKGVGDLSELRDGRPLPPYLALLIAYQTAAALNVLHSLERPVVHSDVKPDNILIADHERLRMLRALFSQRSFVPPRMLVEDLDQPIVKLCDFNLACLAGSQIGSMGTPSYMSPELFRRSAVASPSNDMWAFGMTCVELILGRRPFEGTLEEVQTQVCAKKPRHTKDLKGLLTARLDPFREVIERATDPKPEKRITAATVMEVLEGLFDD